MSTFRITAGAAIALLAAAVAGTALAAGTTTKPILFSASFNGKAVVRVSGSNADISSAQGTGTAVPFGKVTLAGKGTGTQSDPCPLFGGPGTITAARGKLNFVIGPSGGTACTDEGAQDFSLVGTGKFTGGTGKYAKLKGSFRFSGSFNRGTGLFSVKFKGTYTA